MSIAKCGEIFETKRRGKPELKFELVLGGLETLFSTLKVMKPASELTPDDKYKLTLKLSPEHANELHAMLFEQLKEVNTRSGFGLTDKKIDSIIERVLNESENEEGVFRFVSSKYMSYKDAETGEIRPTRMDVYDGKAEDAKLLPDGVMLGKGSVVRSTFTVALFKNNEGKHFLQVAPQKVVVIKKVDPPKRDKPTLSHDGLDDGYAY